RTATFSLSYKENGEPAASGMGAVDFKAYRGKSTLHFASGHAYRAVWDISGIWANTAGLTLYRGNQRLAKPRQRWVKSPEGFQLELVGPLKMLDISRAVDLLVIGEERDVGSQAGLEHFKGAVAFN